MRPPGPSALSPQADRAPAAPPSPPRAQWQLESRRAEPGLRGPRFRLPEAPRGQLTSRSRTRSRGLAVAGQEPWAALRAPLAGGQHGARGRGDQGSREATTEAATEATAALSGAHRARGTRARAASHPAFLAGRRAPGQPTPRPGGVRIVDCRRVPGRAGSSAWLSTCRSRGPAANSAPAADCHAGGRQRSLGQVQRGPGVADSPAWRASLKKAEGGGDTGVRRVRPPGSPRELITAGAPQCGPRRPQAHARLPFAPTHGAPQGLGGDPEGTSPRPPPSCHIARENLQKDEGGYGPASIHGRQLARGTRCRA